MGESDITVPCTGTVSLFHWLSTYIAGTKPAICNKMTTVPTHKLTRYFWRNYLVAGRAAPKYAGFVPPMGLDVF